MPTDLADFIQLLVRVTIPLAPWILAAAFILFGGKRGDRD